MHLIIYISIYFTLFCNCKSFQDNGFKNLADERDFNISSNFHLRKKRVIDKSEGGDRPVHISYVPYIVNILKNGRANCAGGILKAHIIITAAHCLNRRDVYYSLLSGSHYVTGGIHHTIEHIVLHPGYNPERVIDDLAIAIIAPVIKFGNSFNSPIEISFAYVPVGASVTFSGWGCNAYSNGRWIYPQELRSIQVPVISLQDCQNRMLHNVQLTDKEICTLDGHERKCGGMGDSGSPLVRRGKLIGVYSWSGGYGVYGLSPDIFMRVANNGYKEWILSTVQNFINRHPGESSSSRSRRSYKSRRVKRIITKNPDENQPIPIDNVPYIVKILLNDVPNCAGSIIASNMILTAAHCVESENVSYKIVSWRKNASSEMPHTIKVTVVYPGYNRNENHDDLAILVITPPINFYTSVNRLIELNFAYVPPNVPVTFSGWGCNFIERNIMSFPDELRSTEFTVLSYLECKNALAHLATITERDICTLDKTESKCTGSGDSGGPLVRNNKLVGVYAWFGGYHNNKLTPSVFMRLSHPAYREWILVTMKKYRLP